MSTRRTRTAGWRTSILRHFSPEVAASSRLTVVADPDALLVEQGIVEGIRSSGYELIPYEDHVAFRYAYETRYRDLWDRGEATTLVVVLRAVRDDLEGLPFDLLEKARRDGRLLSFSIAELFPKLAPGVVDALDRSDFDVLWAAQETHLSESLGEKGTKDFILRHVLKVAPELIKTPVDLLRTLLRRHYRGRPVPRVLDDRLVEILAKASAFSGWPLQEIVPDRERFFLFLQERWPLFLERFIKGQGGAVREARGEGWLSVPGPVDLPFDHSDIKVYIDNLFLEGLLRPVDGIPREPFVGSWMSVGVVASGPRDESERLLRLGQLIERDLPGNDDDAQAWVETALRWAELNSVRWNLPPEALAASGLDLAALQGSIDGRFSRWLLAWYPSLVSLPYWPRPVMVHQVPHWIAHGDQNRREALLVLDGLSLSEWTAFRPTLSKTWIVREGGVFAWIPTLTSVSRQAIFAGTTPFYFGSSIGTTAKEEHHWRRFWEDRGLGRGEIAYVCQRQLEPEEAFSGRVLEAAETPSCHRLGVVVGYTDQMMHGTVTGAAGLHAQVRQWAAAGHLRDLISALVKLGFGVTITADHGNVEAVGIGKPNVGVVADERGERALVFPDELTRANLAAQIGGTPWPAAGLPASFFPLLAPDRRAFISVNARTVTHGGASIEEVIVPWVRVEASS